MEAAVVFSLSRMTLRCTRVTFAALRQRRVCRTDLIDLLYIIPNAHRPPVWTHSAGLYSQPNVRCALFQKCLRHKMRSLPRWFSCFRRKLQPVIANRCIMHIPPVPVGSMIPNAKHNKEQAFLQNFFGSAWYHTARTALITWATITPRQSIATYLWLQARAESVRDQRCLSR